MYIGIISDTHGVFSPEFKEFLSPEIGRAHV